MLAADVHAAAAERRRAVQVVAVAQHGVARGRVVRPAPPARLGVERVEAAVGRAHVEDPAAAARRAPEHRRGAHGVARVVAPAQPAGAVERVHRAVGGRDVDEPRPERRRGVHVVVGLEAPAHRAGARVERVQRAVERADVDGAVAADGGRRGHEVARALLPLQLAARGHGADGQVERAEVDACRRRRSPRSTTPSCRPGGPSASLPRGVSEYSAPPVLPAKRFPPNPIVTLPSHQFTSWPSTGLRVARKRQTVRCRRLSGRASVRSR